MSRKIIEKREKEKQVVKEMISLYCHKNHHSKQLCKECNELLNYAKMRIDKCPFMETKTFCSKCKVHCYQPQMQKKIKEVMRFSGPRILFYHPILALSHAIESRKINMKIKRGLLIVIGCIGVILGSIGAILPVLPTVPFLLLATICLTKSSKRLHGWFVSTKLYKSNLETFVKGKGMTWKTKIKIMILVTILMMIGFLMMNQVVVGQILLMFVWLFHIIYFIFGIKTLKR